MSVEQLFDETIAAGFIARERKIVENKHEPKSPVYIVAQTYISEGQSKLRELSREFDEKHIEVTTQRDYIKRISPKNRESFEVNCAGVLMGVSLHSFEHVLVDRNFDVSGFSKEYDFAVTGTHLDKKDEDTEGSKKVEDREWRTMIKYAKEDRSLGVFFGDGFGWLPIPFQHLIHETGLRGIISNKLVPVYTEQVNTLSAILQTGTSK